MKSSWNRLITSIPSLLVILHVQLSGIHPFPQNFLVAIKWWPDPIPSRTRTSNATLPMVVRVEPV